MIIRIILAILFILWSLSGSLAQSFQEAKYGGDFLSIGSGARPLGMGGAFTAVTDDVLAGYWNPAGLSAVENWEFAYMHSERFSGVVGYDYGAVAMPVQGSDGVVGLSFFRQGVDGIKNTLHAWDPEQNRPKSDPTSYMTEFSTSDMALLVSYADRLTDRWRWGVTAKTVHSRLGPFANSWGYSMDAGLQMIGKRYRFGLTVMNITTLMKFWNVDQNELQELTSFINPETGKPETLPEGTNEYVKPSLKMGVSRSFDFGDLSLITAFDTDILFEGRDVYYLSVGNISFEPHIGAEIGYKGLVFLRSGITDIHLDDRNNIYLAPTLGTGIKVGSFMIDYGFSSFAGIVSDLGFTHRISLQLTL